MVIEEYLIVTCDFIGRRVVAPALCIFMKTSQYSHCTYEW